MVKVIKINKIILILLIISVVFTSCAKKDNSKNKGDDIIPASANVMTEEEKQLKREEINIKLQEELNNEINSIISGKSGDYSICVKNLNTGLYLSINEKEFVAASVIKLFNMITLYNEVNKGNVVMTQNLRESVRLMITESSNSASNTVVTAIGNGDFAKGAKIVTEFAKNNGCTYTKEEHMLYDDYAPSTGRNRTSVNDCAMMLEKIYNKECISKEYDEEMLELLKGQKRNFKLPVGLPEGTVIAHKTGENSRVEADVGIVFAPSCDYIICISVQSFGNTNVRSTIAEVSSCVYNFFERTNVMYIEEKLI